MNGFMKAAAALMLMMVVMFAAGYKPEDSPNNGGGGSNGGGTYNGHGYVDLGLPSGTLWAICNVGANAPEEYGDYFAWGETSTKTKYNWSTYQVCDGKQKLIKYCNKSHYGYNGFTDTLTVLQPMDDAATANWGNGWCIPTADQWKELRDNTITAWTTQNGVEGRLLTALNRNTLFLPATGCRSGGSTTLVAMATTGRAHSIPTIRSALGAFTFIQMVTACATAAIGFMVSLCCRCARRARTNLCSVRISRAVTLW